MGVAIAVACMARTRSNKATRMFVPSTTPLAPRRIENRSADRGAPVRAPVRVTRISLAELLRGSAAGAREQQDLLMLLRDVKVVTARIADVRPDGTQSVEIAHAGSTLHLALRLAGMHAADDVLIVTLDEVMKHAVSAPEVKLSGSAQLIQELLKPVNKQIVTKCTLAPPLTASPQLSAALAHALQQTVRSSGLFYESHLQRWLNGRFALEDLLEEPQALMLAAEYATGYESAAGEAVDIMPSQLAPLVRQQLDTYAQQTVLWRGFVWPHQAVEITLSANDIGDDADGESEAAAAPRSWQVRLNLELPVLGAVQARLLLTGQALDVHLQVPAASTPALRNDDARTQLTQALSAHGLEAHSIRVAAHA